MARVGSGSRTALAVALGVVAAMPAGATDTPRLAGALPDAESALAATLRDRAAPARLVRVLVDTNGRKTVAGLVVAYPLQLAEPVRVLHRVTWDLAEAAFQALPQLDEVNLTAFHEDRTTRAHRRDVTFTAAISRAEWEASKPAAGVRRGPERSWFHPALRIPPGARRESAIARYVRSVEPPPAQPRPWLARWWDAWVRFVGRLVEPLQRLFGAPAPPPKVYRGTASRPVVALTFDDGPVPVYTPLLLDTLEALEVRTTFFLIGLRAEQYPYWVRAMVRAGHEVANHGYTHADLTQLDRTAVRQDVLRAQRVLHRVAGAPPRYFRPPGGQLDSTVLREAARAGLVTVLWSLAPGDHASPGADVIARRLQDARSGDVVLLHQGISDTLRALPEVVTALRAQGLEPGAVGDVLDEEEPS